MLRTLTVGTLACGVVSSVAAQPTATTFTYQGALESGGSPATGLHDLRFTLFDASSGGAQLGSTQCVNDVTVSNGRFTVSLDFGSQFGASPRWLLIEVRADPSGAMACSNGSGFTALSPRQAVTGAPTAILAQAVEWGNILNMPSGFADGADNGFTTAGTGLTGTGGTVSLDLSLTDARYFQILNNSLGGDVSGLVNATSVNALRGKFLAASATNPQHNDVLTWDINQGGWAPKPTQAWTPGQGLQQITGSYAVDFAVLDLRYLGQNPIVGGDLNGVANAATVTGLQGRAISSALPATNQVLKWSGSQWAPAVDANTSYTAGTGLTLSSNQFAVNFTTLSSSYVDETQSAGGDVSGTFANLSVARLQGRPVLNASPAINDLLRWSGASWVPSAETTYGAGAGLVLAGGNFSIGNASVTPSMLALDGQGLTRVTSNNMTVSGSNIAVGAGIPSEKLHVFGNLAVTGSIATASSISIPNTTRHWSGAALEWTLGLTSGNTDVTYGSNGWTGPSGLTTYVMEQPLHLPHGVSITTLEFFAFDNNGNNFTVEILSQPLNGAAPVSLGSVASSSSASGVRTFTGPVSHVVDNTVNAYRIRASWPTGSQPNNMRLHGVRVIYVVNTPLP